MGNELIAGVLIIRCKQAIRTKKLHTKVTNLLPATYYLQPITYTASKIII